MPTIAAEFFPAAFLYTSCGLLDKTPLDMQELDSNDFMLLEWKFMEAEVLKALKQLPGRKALGRDGMHVIFL